MTGVGKLENVTLDAADSSALAAFYQQLTGWEEARRTEDWITLALPDGQRVAFQHAPDHVPPQWPGQERPQQLHLDLLIGDHRAAAERAIELGATRLADGASWITLADPAGHPFDICQRDEVGPVFGLADVAIDTPDAGALGRFYAGLLGMDVVYEGAEGVAISGDGRTVMFQQIEDYAAPRWPDPQHPQQLHLDVLVDDIDAAEPAALELGATRLDGQGSDFRVFADPHGHPFCLTFAV